jgi:hypothetical protein
MFGYKMEDDDNGLFSNLERIIMRRPVILRPGLPLCEKVTPHTSYQQKDFLVSSLELQGRQDVRHDGSCKVSEPC